MKTIAPLVALLCLLTACGGADATPAAPAPPAAGTEEGAKPVGLDIAAIDIHATELQTAGVATDGDYTGPEDPNTIAWNADGITPGEPGLPTTGLPEGRRALRRAGPREAAGA